MTGLLLTVAGGPSVNDAGFPLRNLLQAAWSSCVDRTLSVTN